MKSIQKREEFLTQGFVKIDSLIPLSEVDDVRQIYDLLLDSPELTTGLRSDLSGSTDRENSTEKITQIMRPSMIKPEILSSQAFQQALSYAQYLLGDDMELDFDMLINKAPFTETETPWHQDAAYWIDMPDKRAVSCWIALDTVYIENGCMWFIPKENEQIHPHKQIVVGGALSCKAESSKGVPVPLEPGGCTFHDGFTLHYSQGNSTTSQRRALIFNFRPKGMIELERAQGIDHTGDRKVRNN